MKEWLEHRCDVVRSAFPERCVWLLCAEAGGWGQDTSAYTAVTVQPRNGGGSTKTKMVETEVRLMRDTG